MTRSARLSHCECALLLAAASFAAGFAFAGSDLGPGVQVGSMTAGCVDGAIIFSMPPRQDRLVGASCRKVGDRKIEREDALASGINWMARNLCGPALDPSRGVYGRRRESTSQEKQLGRFFSLRHLRLRLHRRARWGRVS